MKSSAYSKLRLWEAALLLAFGLALTAGVWACASESALAGRVLRLHVVANSDSDSDQALKLLVRDAVLARAGRILEGAEDRQEAEALLAPHLDELAQAGAEALARTGGPGAAAVIATQASIDSGSFARVFAAAAPGRPLLSVACPALVPLIESGHTGPEDAALMAALEEYLEPIRATEVSALLLGCTHYGIVEEAIAAVLGPDVPLVCASESAAIAMRDYLTEHQLTGGEGREEFYTSGSVETFTAAASAFLGRGIEGRVKHAPLMEV